MRSAVVVAALMLTACGQASSNTAPTGRGNGPAASSTLAVSVTTSVWGDVVRNAFGDRVTVRVVMPDDADPHHFAPSVKQASELERADLIVANGAGLEANLAGAIEAAAQQGTPVFRVTEHVATRSIEAATAGHSDDDHDDEQHRAGSVDPHVWLDPTLVVAAVDALAKRLSTLGVGDAEQISRPYVAQLNDLAQAVSDRLRVVAPQRRLLVTDHDSFEYFADRFDMTVLATIAGSVTSDAEPSAAELERVAAQINAAGVPAVFVGATESDKLARAVIAETGRELAIVRLFTGSLGATGSYVEMMRTNADRMAQALG